MRMLSAAVGRTKIRRPHAERSAETREKILRAACQCIAEFGFSNSSMLGIATRAGVSLGAVQHQFGDKDAIIDAVIDRCLREFSGLLTGLRQAEPNLQRRVQTFTERAWLGHTGPYYRIVLDILLHCPDRTERLAAAHTKLWAEIFGDLKLPARQLLAAQRFTFMMLGGIALESALVPGVEPAKEHFAVLERTLLGRLTGVDRTQRVALGARRGGKVRRQTPRKGV
ncbi:MAG: TetR/AcrR family transcriptional regulator [Deltaproteobacteria bacterium]|nr:TetR/AcrR family transcriptional regulator [Deltaproteobacteria bacterium]